MQGNYLAGFTPSFGSHFASRWTDNYVGAMLNFICCTIFTFLSLRYIFSLDWIIWDFFYLCRRNYGNCTHTDALGVVILSQKFCIDFYIKPVLQLFMVSRISQKNFFFLGWQKVPQQAGWSLCSNFEKKCMAICLKINIAIISSVLVRFWRSNYQIPLSWGRGIDFWCQK